MARRHASRRIEAAPFRRALFAWYRANARRLPWRAGPGDAPMDPWRILVSEFMLQQTTVATVLPRYEEFLARFPSPAAMAAAPEDAVLSAWSGLGYYARARRLRTVARELAARPAWPGSSAEWRDLPGVGDYTAAAISSLALGERALALDTNLVRVLARLTAEARPPDTAAARHALREEGLRLIDPALPGEFNQAMMDLGAAVCVPREPRCDACPVVRWCAAQAAGTERRLPAAARRAAEGVRHRRDLALAIVRPARHGPEILLWRRDGARVYAGMWELPTWREGTARATATKRTTPAAVARTLAWFVESVGAAGGEVRATAPLAGVRHTLTAFRIALDVIPARFAADHPMARRRASAEFAVADGTSVRGQWTPLAAAGSLVQATPQRQLVALLADRLAVSPAADLGLAGFYGLRPQPPPATVPRRAR